MATGMAAFEATPPAVNGTHDGEAVSTLVVVLRTIFISLESVFTMASNPFCIVVILRTPALSDSAKVFMISLAAADLSVGVIAAFSIVPATTGVWLWGDLLCKATAALVTIFCLASVSFLVCLSVDRMIAVTKSLHYPAIMTQRRAVVIAASVWLASGAVIGGSWFVSPVVAFSNSSVTCAWHWDYHHVPFALIVSTCFFIVPSSVLSVMYWIMFKISRKHTRRIANQTPMASTNGDFDPRPSRPQTLSLPLPNHHQQALQHPAPAGDRKAMKMFFTITIAFTVAWLPYSASIIYSSVRSEPVPAWLGFLVTWLALSNSWFNVVIYVCMNGALRETALRLLRKHRCCLGSTARCCPRSATVVEAASPNNSSQAFAFSASP